MKFVKPTMQTWFFIIGILILWGVHQIQFNPTILIRYLAIAFIIFPLTLLAIFSNPKTRNSIKKFYWIERGVTLEEIKKLRKKQEKITDIKEQIEIDQEILSLREGMRSVVDNRFEKCIFYTLILFILTISLTFFDFGIYVNTSNLVFQIIFFLWGLYYIFDMIKSLFFSFNID